MNELSCKTVSDLPCAPADRGPIAAAAAPSPASLRNLRREVECMLCSRVRGTPNIRRCTRFKGTDPAPQALAPGEHPVDHRRSGTKIIGGISQRLQLRGAE